ncbi:hypothetical protein, partial [Phocaeicola vulgatus]|uniref:hypothetical protein n=1 Tax=Phocaeicola vulgatus TaxID=821 RepID=UPI001F325ADC
YNNQPVLQIYLIYFLFPGSHNHRTRYQNILFIRIGKESISDYPRNYGCYGKREYQLSSTVRESTVYNNGKVEK